MVKRLIIRLMGKGSWKEFDNSVETFKRDAFSKHSDLKVNWKVRVQATKGGKAGKTVTVIKGLHLDEIDARKLLKQLKTLCGTGGTIKSDVLELQGDQVIDTINFLKKEGYSPKKSGG